MYKDKFRNGHQRVEHIESGRVNTDKGSTKSRQSVVTEKTKSRMRSFHIQQEQTVLNTAVAVKPIDQLKGLLPSNINAYIPAREFAYLG